MVATLIPENFSEDDFNDREDFTIQLDGIEEYILMCFPLRSSLEGFIFVKTEPTRIVGSALTNDAPDQWVARFPELSDLLIRYSSPGGIIAPAARIAANIAEKDNCIHCALFFLYDRFVEFVDDAWSNYNVHVPVGILGRIWVDMATRVLWTTIEYSDRCHLATHNELSWVLNALHTQPRPEVPLIDAGDEEAISQLTAAVLSAYPPTPATDWRRASDIWEGITDNALAAEIRRMEQIYQGLLRTKDAYRTSVDFRHSAQLVRDLTLTCPFDHSAAALVKNWSPELIKPNMQEDKCWLFIPSDAANEPAITCYPYLLLEGDYRLSLRLRGSDVTSGIIRFTVELRNQLRDHGRKDYEASWRVNPGEELPVNVLIKELSGIYHLRLSAIVDDDFGRGREGGVWVCHGRLRVAKGA